MHKPCVLIPVYNHHKGLVKVLAKLASKDVDCLLVDDGSDKDCKEALQAMAEQYTWVTLFRLETNQGKGTAVCFGLKKAQELGFSHALQVDADGQHDLDDLEQFYQLSKQHPNAIISGERIYSTVPKNRRYGRMLTDVWVWINTLSLSIKDSMCGYRLYPLEPTLAVMQRFNIGKRMDFDTDMIVKCYWQGLEVYHVPTNIVYSEDIDSHFDLWRDNLRITRMHSLLFFGMLLRIPQLLVRKHKSP
jgi:glycosyltransferase involved in cell wall biosynthesis